ncbi:DUF1269 domain-containing protein [Candidatus Nitrosacidococcus sp. I8]|uniref:DUF1269 domain-containing protein n=1 Tax=Candidatus Nitrosacidococcus sp. I8 TaxID=2942908 RepID=UPI002226C313|nr:DUF1269 domain-containing protein [Candidatus Nitrosacidococcus sp. I8]CAH9018675.1 hypothetical protein NURINAE_01067 [Candidatus Nitrosacidococcus sp. I8]
MKRLYFLIQDVEDTRRVVNELLLSHVEERHIHVMAKEETALEGLPIAGFLEKSDFIPSLEKGIVIGGAVGIIAGIIASHFMADTGIIAGGAILVTALAGVGIGSWASSMIGVGVPNTQVKKFEEAVNQGNILMMVDIPAKDVERINHLIGKDRPKVKAHGAEPAVPAFP